MEDGNAQRAHGRGRRADGRHRCLHRSRNAQEPAASAGDSRRADGLSGRSRLIAAETMRAAVLLRPGVIELQDLPRPEPPPGGMVVRVRTALTDGTDFKAYRPGHPPLPMPTPFGHAS